MEQTECVVIGAGVLGLAIARALALSGRETILLEATGAFGTQSSSRNNEVIHAGFLYPPDTLRGSLCRVGRDALYRYCESRSIPAKPIGKLMIATNEAELAQLETFRSFAAAWHVDDLQMLGAVQATALEPALRSQGALLSPSTGIVDSHGLMLSLLGEFEAAGGSLALGTLAEGVSRATTGFAVQTAGPSAYELGCRVLVNAAGLGAHRLALSLAGADAALLPKIRYAKGSFFALNAKSPFSRLIVPLGETLAGGGAFTLDLAGRGRFGPDLEWVETIDYSVDEAKVAAVSAVVRRYYPDLPDGTLSPAYSGIRPRIAARPGELPDWAILGPPDHGTAGLVHLLGMDSPGLTSCLAIADHVLSLLNDGPRKSHT